VTLVKWGRGDWPGQVSTANEDTEISTPLPTQSPLRKTGLPKRLESYKETAWTPGETGP